MINQLECDFTFNGVELHAEIMPGRMFMGSCLYQISWKDGSLMTTTSGKIGTPIEKVVEDFKKNGF